MLTLFDTNLDWVNSWNIEVRMQSLTLTLSDWNLDPVKKIKYALSDAHQTYFPVVVSLTHGVWNNSRKNRLLPAGYCGGVGRGGGGGSGGKVR